MGLYYRDYKVLFLGLDNAGKTTMLCLLRDGKIMAFDPTFQPNSEELIIGNVKFTTHDLGGHEGARKLWRDYYPSVHGIVYFVDAADPERFQEAKTELDRILSDDLLSNTPVVVFGNKIDLRGAASEHELKHALGLYQTTGKDPETLCTSRPVEVFMCTVAKNMGFKEGFDWLSHNLKHEL